MRLVTPLLQASLMAIVFSLGLRAVPADVLYVWRRPGLLARSLLAVLVVMPVVAVLLAKAFDFPAVVKIALVALSISPLPPLLPQRELKAGGVEGYGIGLMVTLSALSLGYVPLMAQLLQVVFGREFTVAGGKIAILNFAVVLAPLLVGMAVCWRAPRMADRIGQPVARVARILLLIAIAALVIAAAPAIWAVVGIGTLLAVIVFVVVGFGVGHLLGGPEPGHAAVLSFATACRHPATAMAIAAANYPDRHFQGVVLLYATVNIAIGISYVAWGRRGQMRHGRAADGPE